MLYEVFSYARRAGGMALEPQVEEPESSSIFSSYPELLRDSATLGFLCDHQEPVHALSTVADSLPDLGIVAASVLGVVITMQSIGSSSETVGERWPPR